MPRCPRLSLPLLSVLLLQAAAALAMPPVYKRFLKQFDGDHRRLAPDFGQVTDGNRSRLQGYLVRLENHLKKIPKSMRSDAEYLARSGKLDALKAKLGGGAAGAPSAPGGLPGPLAKASQVYEAAGKAMGAWTHEQLDGARAALKEVQEAMRAVKKVKRQHGAHPRYTALRKQGADLYGAIRKRISKLEQEARGAAKAGRKAARATATTTVKVAAGSRTDAQIAREFQSRYNAVYNQLRRARSSELLDAAKVAAYRTQLDELGALVGSYADPSQGFARQTKANHESLVKWFDKSIEKAKKSRAAHEVDEKKRAAAREAAAAAARVVPRARPKPDASKLDYQAKRALDFFDRDYDRYAAGFDSAGLDNAENLSSKIQALENRLSKVPPRYQGHPEVASRRDKVAALAAKLDKALGGKTPLTSDERKQLEKFKSEYARVKNVLIMAISDPISLARPGAKENVRKSLDRLLAPLEKIANREHPLVAAAYEKLRPVQEAVGKAVASADAMVAEAGDMDAQYAQWTSQFPYQKFDPSLTGSTPAEIQAWAAKLRVWEKGAKDANRFFEIAGRLYSKRKTQEFKAYRTWVRGRPQVLIDHAKKQTRGKWETEIRSAAMNLGIKVDNISPSQVPVMTSRFQAILPTIDKLIAFQRGYDGKSDPELETKKEKFQDLIERLSGTLGKRLEAARMPTPSVPQDAKLLAHAREVLARPKYGVGEYRRLIVTSTVKTEREVEYYDGKWIPREWDQFHVSLAAKDPKKGGRWFIKHGRLRFFRKAYRTTPTGKWILSDFFGTQEIKEEHTR